MISKGSKEIGFKYNQKIGYFSFSRTKRDGVVLELIKIEISKLIRKIKYDKHIKQI